MPPKSGVINVEKWQHKSVSNASMREKDGFVMIAQKVMNVVKKWCSLLLILRELEYAGIVGDEYLTNTGIK